MQALAYVRTMAAYSRWMNERLYALCAELPDAERKRDRAAFFCSIHGTLNRLLLADRLWLGRFTGVPFAIEGLDQELHADFDELSRARAGTDDAIDAWVATLDDEELWLPVAHFFNHQTHHRGQLTTLLEQAGRDPGVTDLIRLPGIESLGHAEGAR